MSNHLVRYAEFKDGTCTVLEWGEGLYPTTATPRQRTYPISRRPAWVVQAVNIGRVGGYAWRTGAQEVGPVMVMWFTVTPAPGRRVVEYRTLDIEP